MLDPNHENLAEKMKVYEVKFDILREVFDKCQTNLREENEYLKKQILDFIPDREYYKKVWTWMMENAPPPSNAGGKGQKTLTWTEVEKLIDARYKLNSRSSKSLNASDPKPRVFGRKPNVQPLEDITKRMHNESVASRMCNVSLGNTGEKIDFQNFPEIKDKMSDRDQICVKSPVGYGRDLKTRKRTPKVVGSFITSS